MILDYPFQKALKNSTNQEEINQLINLHRDSSFSGSITLFWAISIFIIFKISYFRKQGLWKENNKNKNLIFLLWLFYAKTCSSDISFITMGLEKSACLSKARGMSHLKLGTIASGILLVSTRQTSSFSTVLTS